MTSSPCHGIEISNYGGDTGQACNQGECAASIHRNVRGDFWA